MKQKFLCPACYRKYEREGKVVQDRVVCSCGFDFWVYKRPDMCIISPWGDRRSLMLVNTLERMEQGGQPKKQNSFCALLRSRDPGLVLEISMRNVQQDGYGEELMHGYDVKQILDYIYKGNDALVRKKKDGVVVFELDPNASKKIRPIPIDYSCLSDPELIHLAETGTDPREWQTEIMDQNDERSGLASGNAG